MLAVCVAGARPNFMKVKPVLDALERRKVEVRLVHTGQHYDAAMSKVFFEELGLREPDHWLGVGSGSHAQQTAGVMLALEPVFAELAPDLVVVVGDVNSTLAAALVASKATIPVAHVEAGLRSGDWAMPEEVNRVVTDRLSHYLFAPSGDAVENLRSEGYPYERIHLVGNVMVDTLLANIERVADRQILAELGLVPGQFGLVTLHRPSNVDNISVLAKLMEVMGEVAMECPLVLPLHPRAARNLAEVSLAPNIVVIEALGYLDFLALESKARLVMTDSGGVQEETTVLGVPCLTLRETTERPITVTEGTNVVVGLDPACILTAARRALRDGAVPNRPALWDGQASERIAEVLCRGS